MGRHNYKLEGRERYEWVVIIMTQEAEWYGWVVIIEEYTETSFSR